MSSLEITRGMDRPPQAPGRVDAQPLVGTWVNFDHTSKAIARLVIGEAGDVLRVRTWGVCSPEPCDWGAVPGKAFAAGVTGGNAIGFRADYDFDFMETTLVAYLNLRLLVVDTYNTFKDGTGRTRYFTRDHFYQP